MLTIVFLMSCAKSPAPAAAPSASPPPSSEASSATTSTPTTDCLSQCLDVSTGILDADCAEACNGVVLPCVWPEGFEVRYDHVRQRTNAQQPLLAEMSSTTPVTITVRESRPGYSRIDYAVGPTTFEGPPEVVDAAQALVGDTATLPTMELVMRDGSVDEIANLPEIVDVMFAVVERSTPPGPQREQVLAQTRALFDDPATGNQLALRDVAKFFAMHCMVGLPGEALESETGFANPFGAEPIPGTSTVAFDPLDEGSERLIVRTRDATAPDALDALLPAIVERFAPPGSEPSDAQIEELLSRIPPIDSVQVGEMAYSTSDGFPHAVEVRLAVGTEDNVNHRTDLWRWTRVD